MRDKQLREEFGKFRNDLTGITWDSSSVSYNGSTIGKIHHRIKKLEYQLEYEFEYNDGCMSVIPKRSIVGRIIDLESSMKQVLENQKLIIEYLGIEKVEEPPKTFYKKIKEKK